MSEFTQKLDDSLRQNWHARLADTSRGAFYVLFHEQLCTPYYLDNIINVKYRNALTRYRTSSHKLRVETGRWVRPLPHAEKKCVVCGVLDDEYHFVIKCEMHTLLTMFKEQIYTKILFCKPKYAYIYISNSTV